MKVSLILTLILSVSCLFVQAQQDILLLKTDGKVVIGDITAFPTPGNYSLYVENGILTERVKVAVKNTSDWSDNAFQLTPTLKEVKKSIESNKHLPGIPSAAKVVKEGYDVQHMDAKLLAQIEWLWQYTIELNEDKKRLEKDLKEMKALLTKLESKQ